MCDVIWTFVISVDASALIVIPTIKFTTNSGVTDFRVNKKIIHVQFVTALVHNFVIRMGVYTAAKSIRYRRVGGLVKICPPGSDLCREIKRYSLFYTFVLHFLWVLYIADMCVE